MCGRFTQRQPLANVAQDFEARLAAPEARYFPQFNAAPTQSVAIVRAEAEGPGRQLALVRWGLIPSWAKDMKIGNSTINARGETVAEKPAFRSAFKKRRCLVVADGFYEWKKGGKVKQPYFIHRTDDKPFAFAGLWETWYGPDKEAKGEPLETCTIVTTTANDLMSPLHDRMPVILNPIDYDLWLDPTIADREKLEPLIVPYEGDEFTSTQVSTFVNNVRNQGPECVVPMDLDMR